MNRTVPTARLGDTEAEKKARLRRGAKLRVIDKGNNYDVTGKLRRMIHEIEQGKHGNVTDVVLAVRYIQEGRTGIRTIYLGKSQPEVLHYMGCVLVKEMMP